MPMLSELLDLPDHPLIAIVGAGGKTTTMYTLAGELAQHGKRVITTTTSSIYLPRPDETGALITAAETSTILDMIRTAWKLHHRLTVARAHVAEGKLAGLLPEQPYELLMLSGAGAVIVEADGARHRMIKAPAEHEPVVPSQTNVALLVMSAGAINQPLSAEIAHRPERVAAVLAICQGDVLTPALIAKLLLSEQGAMKGIPGEAKVYALITHATAQKWREIQELVSLLRGSPRLAGVLYSEQPGEWSVYK